MDLAEARSRAFDAGPRHPWERARLALASNLVARNTTLRKDDIVLDIGCGDTFVVEALARQYPHVRFYAVDTAFTPELIALFERRLTASNVSLASSLDDVPQEKAASLILLMDVLEHVDDAHGLLRDLRGRSHVAVDTQLLITVPAYPSLFCSHDRFLGHYRRYSAGSLRSLMMEAGLKPDLSGHFFASLLPIRLAQVLVERLWHAPEHAPTGLATWEGSEWLARALAAILELDGRLSLALLRFGVPLPGLSCFALCRTSA
ncbi:MAG: class I SAM-dependent methyltransferase [Vicinamibacterales bacterium]